MRNIGTSTAISVANEIDTVHAEVISGDDTTYTQAEIDYSNTYNNLPATEQDSLNIWIASNYSPVARQSARNSVQETGAEALSLMVFPNPTSSAFTVQYSLTENEKSVHVEILSQLGEIVTTIHRGVQQAGDYSFNVDLESENLSTGTYYVRLRFGQRVLTKEIKYIR